MRIKKGWMFLTATVLAAVLLLTGCGEGDGDSAQKNAEDAVYLALSGGALGDDFSKNPNPLYATTDFEYQVGCCFAPTLMYRDENGNWISNLGSIEISEKDGKTVATVSVKDGVKYYGGGVANASDYIALLKKITEYDYKGYFKNFYRNPIEGLAAYRYNLEGLTIENVPDFEKNVDQLFSGFNARKYKAMLLETDIVGLYGASATPDSKAPDGRTFKEIVIQESKSAALKGDDFFEQGDVRKNMLEELATIYSSKPKDEWMTQTLYDIKYENMHSKFVKNCLAQNRPTEEISGIEVVSVKAGKAMSVAVTFTKILNEDEAIEMLNLPILPWSSLTLERNVIGAGSIKYLGYAKGSGGCAIKLSGKNQKKYIILSLNEENYPATLYMKQISAAVYSDSLSKEQQQKTENDYGLKFLTHSGKTVVYHPELISEKELTEALNLILGKG